MDRRQMEYRTRKKYEKYGHDAIFPEELAKRVIKLFPSKVILFSIHSMESEPRQKLPKN